MHTKKSNLKVPVFVSLFASLIASGGFIQLPLPTGVPFVVQDMMALLAGVLLGPVYGFASVVLFLFLGCIGLPVFSLKAGIGVIVASPTGGFLIGDALGAVTGGVILALILPRNKKHSALYTYAAVYGALLCAFCVLFACGVWGFVRVTGAAVETALAVTVLPFLPISVVKMGIAAELTKRFRPVVSGYIC